MGAKLLLERRVKQSASSAATSTQPITNAAEGAAEGAVEGPVAVVADRGDRGGHVVDGVVERGGMGGLAAGLEAKGCAQPAVAWEGGGGGEGSKMTADTESSAAAEAAALLAEVGQPPLAASLLANDPQLAALRPPLAADDGGSSARATSGGPHATHFGHEDLMAKQFEPSSPPPSAWSARESGKMTATPIDHNTWTSPKPIPLDDLVVDDADGEEDGGPVLGLAGIVFTDGSSCSCSAWCARKGPRECCDGFEHMCRWESSETNGPAVKRDPTHPPAD